VRLQYRLACLGHDEGRKARRHRLGVEHDHAVGGSDGEFRRERHYGEAGHFAGDGGRAAAIGEGDIGPVGEEDPFDRAFAGNEGGRLGPAPVELLCLGLERSAAAGAHGLGAGEDRPGIVAGGIAARRRSGKAYRRIEQAIQHVGGGEADRAPCHGAEAVAGEIDHEALGMARGKAPCVLHVGGREQVGIGPGFDLLAHEAGGPEFGRCDRIRARRKATEQIGEGRGQAAGPDHAQRVRQRRRRKQNRRGRKQNQRDQAGGKAAQHNFLRTSSGPL
jgi:hypothetical protein